MAVCVCVCVSSSVLRLRACVPRLPAEQPITTSSFSRPSKYPRSTCRLTHSIVALALACPVCTMV
eukprot:40489-Eustigmatos_ZCMA.PRE.1